MDEDGGTQRLCLLLLLAEAVEQSDNVDEVEFDGSNLLDWLLSFFLSTSRTLFSALIWRTFVSSKAAGRTHLHRRPSH